MRIMGGGENDRCNEITAGGEMYGGVENLWDDENDGGGENEGSQINAVGNNHGSDKRMRMMDQVSMNYVGSSHVLGYSSGCSVYTA